MDDFPDEVSFNDYIDHLNKPTFYLVLGRAANESMQSGLLEKNFLGAIIAEVKDFWRNRPLKNS